MWNSNVMTRCSDPKSSALTVVSCWSREFDSEHLGATVKIMTPSADKLSPSSVQQLLLLMDCIAERELLRRASCTKHH